MNNNTHILVVDDDQGIRELLCEFLQQHGFEVHAAKNGEQMRANLKSHPIDLIILDIMMPGEDGMTLCKSVRQNSQVPIIMLTAQDSDADTILGLEAGAKDYVTKPFRLNVLLARMRAQLRQFANTEDAVFSIGPYSFQPANKIMLHGENDQKIRLTEKETAILKYLLRAQDKVVGRDTLLGEVWGYNANVTTHTLETHVYRLRQKIEADPSNAALLVTEPGGYRLVPD